MPLISVIMGVYNSDPVKLTAAVNSVLNQSVGDIELIIYNDGSDNRKNTERINRPPRKDHLFD